VDLGSVEEVSEYIDLSLKYLLTSRMSLDEELFEPALFNGLHALELAVKALLVDKVKGPLITHNVGGLLGRHYREVLGNEVCREINKILIMYDIPRYPGIDIPDEGDINDTVERIGALIEGHIKPLVEMDTSFRQAS